MLSWWWCYRFRITGQVTTAYLFGYLCKNSKKKDHILFSFRMLMRETLWSKIEMISDGLISRNIFTYHLLFKDRCLILFCILHPWDITFFPTSSPVTENESGHTAAQCMREFMDISAQVIFYPKKRKPLETFLRATSLTYDEHLWFLYQIKDCTYNLKMILFRDTFFIMRRLFF